MEFDGLTLPAGLRESVQAYAAYCVNSPSFTVFELTSPTQLPILEMCDNVPCHGARFGQWQEYLKEAK